MIYITFCELNSARLLGVKKKIQAQIQVFEKYYQKVYYTQYSGKMFSLVLDDEVIEKEVALSWADCMNFLISWIKKYKISRTYMRNIPIKKCMIDFFEKQKQMGIKFVLEIVTYPYNFWFQNNTDLSCLEDSYYRQQMYQYVNRVVTYTSHKQIFDIPCINLQNGVELTHHPVRKIRNKDEKIVLIAVAAMHPWHGYERVIEGMKNYYEQGGKREIVLKLIGEGLEIPEYKRLTRKYGLDEHVEFHGRLDGKALDEQYNLSDIAIGVLGGYKVGLEETASIKLREYCARGIPFVHGDIDLGFTDEEDFTLKVENNSQPLNMQHVIDFYDRVVESENMISEMRQIAEQKFTWDVLLKPVIEYFEMV